MPRIEKQPAENLSIDMRERLTSALYLYEGTLLIVSHEQQSLSNLRVDSILRLPEGTYKNIFWEG